MGKHHYVLVCCFCRSPRPSITPDMAPSLSPRNSLVPPESRSPRNSLVPGDAYRSSPRNSLVPESALSPRNSLVPGDYNRSPRNSLIPDVNRSPRHSLVPDTNGHSTQRLNVEYSRSPRNSLVPDGTRTPRRSLVPSESSTWNQSNLSLNEERNGRHNGTEEVSTHMCLLQISLYKQKKYIEPYAATNQ